MIKLPIKVQLQKRCTYLNLFKNMDRTEAGAWILPLIRAPISLHVNSLQAILGHFP